MTDEELVQAFESGALEEFPHESHTRVAWWYLTQDPIMIALPRFRAALQRFAAGKGKPERYHETITVAYMLLIADRLGRDRGLTWPAFAARHPDLLRRNPSALSPFYSDELLGSASARERFVMPDRA